MYELDYNLDAAYAHLQRQLPGVMRVQGSAGFCLRRNGQAVAAAVFYDYSGPTIWVHVAGSPGGHWLTRRFLRAYLSYPFVTCGVSCLRGYVRADNARLLRLVQHLGGAIEARLQGAASDGGDMVIVAIWKDGLTYEPLA